MGTDRRVPTLGLSVGRHQDSRDDLAREPGSAGYPGPDRFPGEHHPEFLCRRLARQRPLGLRQALERDPRGRSHLTCTIYDRDMATDREPGPDPDEITRWITTTYPDTVVTSALGASFFSLDEKHWPNF